MGKLLHEELSEKIIGCFYEVYNELGHGFLEKVYENALAVEFRKVGLGFGQQVGIDVMYKGNNVGKYVADFIVEGKVVVEVKSVNCLSDVDEAQLINYLKATGVEVGLLFNFGKEAKFERRIFENKIAADYADYADLDGK